MLKICYRQYQQYSKVQTMLKNNLISLLEMCIRDSRRIGYVGAIERKRDQRPSFDVAFKICKVLNISLDRILFPAESREHLNAKEALKQRIDQCDAYEIGLLEATFTAILAYHRFFEMNETIEAYEKTADNS